MSKSYKIIIWVLMAATLIVAIIDVKLANYEGACYLCMQFVWTVILYFALCGWLNAIDKLQETFKEEEKTCKELAESLQREQIAQEVIKDLRKRLETKNK